MGSNGEIIKEYVGEIIRIQNWMLIVEDTFPDLYKSMYDRYIELKVVLTSLGVNLTEIDRVNK